MRISFAQIAFCFFLLISPGIKAQDFHKISLYFGVHRTEAMGSYKTYLEDYDSRPDRYGLYGGILFNPMPKLSYNSPLNIGLEMGGNGWGSELAQNFYGATYDNHFRSFYTNFVARYRPFAGPVKVSPFLDVFGGPMWMSSVVRELVSQDEYRQIFKFGRSTKNYGMGAGAGLRRRKHNGDHQFIDIGIYYQNVERVASVRRKTIYLDQSDNADYALEYIKPNTWKVKLSLTGFL